MCLENRRILGGFQAFSNIRKHSGIWTTGREGHPHDSMCHFDVLKYRRNKFKIDIHPGTGGKVLRKEKELMMVL